MDQGETSHGGIRPSHIVLDGDPALPPQRGTAPNFPPMSFVAKRKKDRWIKMPLGTKVDFGSDHTMLDGGPSSPPEWTQPPIFGPCPLWPNGWMDHDATGTEVGLGLGDIVLDGGPAPPTKKGHSTPFSAHVCCGQTAGWIKSERVAS